MTEHITIGRTPPFVEKTEGDCNCDEDPYAKILGEEPRLRTVLRELFQQNAVMTTLDGMLDGDIGHVDAADIFVKAMNPQHAKAFENALQLIAHGYEVEWDIDGPEFVSIPVKR